PLSRALGSVDVDPPSLHDALPISQGKPTFFDLNAFPDTIAPVLFHDHLDPDILLVGFSLTQAQVLDPNAKWWFILAEHPTAPRLDRKSTRLNSSHQISSYAVSCLK